LKADGTIEDKVLWSAFLKGDKAAFEMIYRQHFESLVKYGQRISSDKQLIKDCIQDVFLNLWSKRENLSETDAIKLYLFKSLKNKIIRNLPEKEQSLDANVMLENILHEISSEEDYIKKESGNGLLIKLRAAIQNLPKRQQEALQLRYYHEFSYEEVASIMQVNYQSVRNFIHKAVVELRQNVSYP
jgi:RNA polymerase sigma factor (sigma-70 family)